MELGQVTNLLCNDFNVGLITKIKSEHATFIEFNHVSQMWRCAMKWIPNAFKQGEHSQAGWKHE